MKIPELKFFKLLPRFLGIWAVVFRDWLKALGFPVSGMVRA